MILYSADHELQLKVLYATEGWGTPHKNLRLSVQAMLANQQLALEGLAIGSEVRIRTTTDWESLSLSNEDFSKLDGVLSWLGSNLEQWADPNPMTNLVSMSLGSV